MAASPIATRQKSPKMYIDSDVILSRKLSYQPVIRLLFYNFVLGPRCFLYQLPHSQTDWWLYSMCWTDI